MSINIIACMDLNCGIGVNNTLPWHFPNDLKRFKELTKDNFVVMGRITYQSLGKPLPNRINIILSKNKKFKTSSNTFVYRSMEDVIEKYHKHNNDQQELFIIGGSEVYKQALPIADKLYLTIIENKYENIDSYFPVFSFEEWKVEEHITNEPDEKHPYYYHYITYEKKK